MKPRLCECGKPLLWVKGPKNSDVLIIGEFPGEEELQQLLPFVGYSGKILRAELGRVGIDMRQCRITNLWRHEPVKTCFDLHAGMAIQEAKNRKAILLLGSECANLFIGKPVTKVQGLRVKSDKLSCKFIVTSQNPASVLHGGVGEFRLSMRRFSDLLDEAITDE